MLIDRLLRKRNKSCAYCGGEIETGIVEWKGRTSRYYHKYCFVHDVDRYLTEFMRRFLLPHYGNYMNVTEIARKKVMSGKISEEEKALEIYYELLIYREILLQTALTIRQRFSVTVGDNVYIFDLSEEELQKEVISDG